MKKFYLINIFILFLSFFIMSCQDYPEKIYSPDLSSKPQPVITGFSPAEGTSAGVGEVLINGRNFSSIKEENSVYFNGIKANILSASETQIKVKAPNIIGDSIMVKISVYGSLFFSSPAYFKLVSVWKELGDIISDNPTGIDLDANGNIYVALMANGVRKIAVSNNLTSTEIATFPYLNAPSLKYAQDGSIFITKSASKDLYYIPVGQNTAVKYVTLKGRGYDMDFDKDGNLWICGNNTEIYKLKSDKSSLAYPCQADARSIRIYNDYVYVSGIRDTSCYIWRYKITGDNLGSEEVYFDWGKRYGNYKGTPLSITFSNDGDMYVGTDATDAIVIVHPNGTFEPLYPGVLEQTSFRITWGSGKYNQYLLISKQSGTNLSRVIQLFIGKDGAPYYGRK